MCICSERVSINILKVFCFFRFFCKTHAMKKYLSCCLLFPSCPPFVVTLYYLDLKTPEAGSLFSLVLLPFLVWSVACIKS